MSGLRLILAHDYAPCVVTSKTSGVIPQPHQELPRTSFRHQSLQAFKPN